MVEQSVREVELPDASLLRRFDVPGPRYTSYPTADRFIEAFDADSYAGWLRSRVVMPARPLSLYVHIPFCNTICYYCACNKVITRDRSKAVEYLEFLEREIELIAGLLEPGQTVEQLHLGGGSPTYLSNEELQRLMEMITQRFHLDQHGEHGVEVDPRTAPPDKIRTLAALGFNRLSVGVQDFDPQVQRAVNRIQSFEMTQATMLAARDAGFRSLNLDLIYGLPQQSRDTFSRTLDQVLELAPDRVALYHYAHLPERFKPQRRISSEQVPSSEEKLQIMMQAIRSLTESGYEYIGMDHFALFNDDLARAQRLGHLHRNFQGYSTRPDCDLVGLGVSAISKVGPTYSQNAGSLEEYYDRPRSGLLPTVRGVLLNADDLLRRAVIMALMCHFEASKEAISLAHLVRFDEYFHRELVDSRRCSRPVRSRTRGNGSGADRPAGARRRGAAGNCILAAESTRRVASSRTDRRDDIEPDSAPGAAQLSAQDRWRRAAHRPGLGLDSLRIGLRGAAPCSGVGKRGTGRGGDVHLRSGHGSEPGCDRADRTQGAARRRWRARTRVDPACGRRGTGAFRRIRPGACGPDGRLAGAGGRVDRLGLP
jgi:oxygen-independent coproporphyrinogen-3 oxidase